MFGTLDLTDKYKYVKVLGHGAFGEVLLAEDVTTGQQVAAKQLYLPHPDAPLPPAVAREVWALRKLQHSNIIAVKDVAVNGCCVYLCQELCCTDLAAVLAGADQQLPPQLTCCIMQQLLAALAACHAAGVIHRDVKPSNILVTASGVIKLADFGLAKSFRAQHGSSCSDHPSALPGQQAQSHDTTHGHQHQHQHQHYHPRQQQQLQQHHHQQQQHCAQCAPECHTPAQGTRWYRAPELLFGSTSYGPEVDLWAAGCVLAEMLGLTPFIPGQSDIDQLARMQHKLGSITTDNWPGVEQLPDWHKVSFAHSDGEQLEALLPDAPPAALDLLQQLLCYDPSKRLPAEAALHHSYFAATGEAAVTAVTAASPLSDQRAWSGC